MLFSFLNCYKLTKLGRDGRGNEKLKGKQMREGVTEFNCAFLIFWSCFSPNTLIISTWFECLERCNKMGLFWHYL